MPKNTKPSVSEMRRFLSYDPNSGALTWRARNADDFIAGVWSAETQANSWNSRYAGKSAFDAISSNGYKKGTINNHTCLAHRVCWAIVLGDRVLFAGRLALRVRFHVRFAAVAAGHSVSVIVCRNYRFLILCANAIRLRISGRFKLARPQIADEHERAEPPAIILVTAVQLPIPP
jgi:hypothetical protein